MVNAVMKHFITWGFILLLISGCADKNGAKNGSNSAEKIQGDSPSTANTARHLEANTNHIGGSSPPKNEASQVKLQKVTVDQFLQQLKLMQGKVILLDVWAEF